MRHTRNPSRMKNTFDELSAVIEDQVIVSAVPGIWITSSDCAFHGCGLISRHGNMDIPMWGNFATAVGMRRNVIFRTSSRSPEYALPPRNLRVNSGVPYRVISVHTDADMPEPTGTFRPVGNAHIIRALALRRSD